MTSEGGATLTYQVDHSILVTGDLADKDAYTLVFRSPFANITGIRLEPIPDPSLPFQGPGRAPGNGNFELSEIVLEIAEKKVPLSIAWADWNALADDHYLKKDMRANWTIDGDPLTYWNTWPRLGAKHRLIVQPKQPVGKFGDTLTVRLLFHAENPRHALGRFRISFTTSATPVTNESWREELTSRDSSVWTSIAVAARLRSDWPGVIAAIEKSMKSTPNVRPLETALLALGRAHLKDKIAGKADLERARTLAAKRPNDALLKEIIGEAAELLLGE